jgi:hypothetical protein
VQQDGKSDQIKSGRVAEIVRVDHQIIVAFQSSQQRGRDNSKADTEE